MKQKQPKLRFPEFSGDWESKMLGEISDIVRGASPRPIQDPKWFDDKSDVGWLRISDVTKQNGRIHFLSQRISKLGQAKTRVLLTPHLLLSIAATVGKPVINYVQTGVHDGFLIFLSPKFNIEFMFHWLNFFQSKWQQCGQPGSQVNLNSDLVKMTNVFLPTLQEQQKIGAFFKDLDDNIELNRKKLTELKDLKSSLLQKMFPKKGAKVPEIRFPEFSGDWEERKLGEIINKMYQPKTITSSELSLQGYPVFGANGYIGFYTKANHVKDQVTISARGEGTGTINYVNAPVWITGNSMVLDVDEKKINKLYLYATLLSTSLHKFITGGAQPQLTRESLINVPINTTNLQEQQKIGAFFKNLDELIEAQQNKLALLTEQKKALLQQMFV